MITISLFLVGVGNQAFAQTQQNCIDEADELLAKITPFTTSEQNITNIDNAKSDYISCMDEIGIAMSPQYGIYGLTDYEWQVIYDSDDNCVLSVMAENPEATIKEFDDASRPCDVLYAQMIRDTIQNNRIITKEITSDPQAKNVTDLVVLETNLGTIVIEFFHEDAPNHVDNFIGLAESGFYDGTIFHRIIPGFMIQGGDPNTISGDPSTWGTGGPGESVNAEFNTIKHNRGIVSMARSADPNSAGSQFFIIHQNSNFLDEQYTVFGRIVTEESFGTLDKIAAVQTGVSDRPTDTEQVKIIKVTTVNRPEVSNILELSEPERTQITITPSSGNQKFESTELGITFSVPEGWMLQEPEKTQENSPDVVAVGPKVGLINPAISFTVQQTNQRTLDDLISEKAEALKEVIELGNLNIISQELTTINGIEAHVVNSEGFFSSNGKNLDVKFQEVLIYGTEKFYIFAYVNDANDFNSQLPRFEETINSFEILSVDSSVGEPMEEGGGCLIATATFDSELAPQVQQLRELRENTILSTESGIAFMTVFNQLYYLFSPTIADLEREHPVFKQVVKLSITPMLSTLSILNYAEIDSEEKLLSYGIGIILMNVGMYFVAPAIFIYKIKKHLTK